MNVLVDKALVNEIEMPYLRFGSGNKVFVILPGLSIKPLTESASTIAEAFNMFADDYTVYLFDRRTNIPNDYSINQMAEDTYQVMKYLDIDKADFFGASQGGMILEDIAVNHGEIINGMVLGSTICRNNETVINVVNGWIELAKEHDGYNLNKSICESIYSKTTYELYKDVFLSMGTNISVEDMERFVILASSIINFDISKDLYKIANPTLVIGCRGDKVTTCEGSQEITDLLHCDSYTYDEGYGHAVFDEASDYRTKILSFLKQ